MPPMKRPAVHAIPRSLSLSRLARRWQISRRETRRLLQQGELPFEQVRGQLRVPLKSIEEYEAERHIQVHSLR